ncbi:MAG: DNA polymerase IV [Bacteroidota bacterium]
MGHRRIAHVDLDAFYASVEQRDDPALANRPVAVGGRTRGVVMAASYEARGFGIRSAMPVRVARRLCPDLITVKPRFDAYREASNAFHEALSLFADRIDRVGLDEAYLDLSHMPPPSARLGKTIRAAVYDATRLTCSVGVSTSKFVAKIASDADKPNGVTVVAPHKIAEFVGALPVERFHGVGPATASRLHARGYRYGADLQGVPASQLEAELGRTGRWLAQAAFGRDDRPVGVPRKRKSVGAERTHFAPLRRETEARDALNALSITVATRLARHHLAARTISVKARSPAFETSSRQRTLVHPVWTAATLSEIAWQLLLTPHPMYDAYRLLGITASQLVDGNDLVVATQLELGLS